MSPFEQMKRKYRDNPQERSFDVYLDWHMRHGFVFATPDFFVMGRAAAKGILERVGVALQPVEPEFQDTWYVHAMAGDLRLVWSILPWPLPYVAFERLRGGRRELTVLQTDRIRRLCEAAESPTLSFTA